MCFVKTDRGEVENAAKEAICGGERAEARKKEGREEKYITFSTSRCNTLHLKEAVDEVI